MRNNLITVLHCSECGKPLELVHPEDAKAKRCLDDQNMEPEMPTGARMLANRVDVEPCKHCIEKHTAPARALAKAIKAIDKTT